MCNNMKNLLTIIFFFTYTLSFSQNLDSLIQSPPKQQLISLKQLLKKGDKWVKVMSYELKDDTIFKHNYSFPDTFKFSKNKFIIPRKCNNHEDCSTKGKVKYFGSCMTLKYHRLEKSNYCLIGLYNNYLILESNYHPIKIESQSKTKNGKKTIESKSIRDYSKTISKRYVFIKQST